MIGLGILVIIGAVAVYAVSQPLSWHQLEIYCAANYGPDNPASGYPGAYTPTAVGGCPGVVCTYVDSPPPNSAQYCGGLWYKTPSYHATSFASMVGPTISLKPLSVGPMPLGALTLGVYGSSMFNIYPALLRGADWSLIFSVGIVGIGSMAGLLVGAVAGYYGGTVDDVLMRLVDIFLSIPVILFVVVVVIVVTLDVPNLGGLGAANSKLLMVILGFAAVWWPFYARLVRGQVLVVREQKFVESAKASGATKRRILVRHIIPNSVYPVFIQFSLDVGTIPLLIGGLAYLGFGPELFPNLYFPEWGNITQLGVVQISNILGTCVDSTGCVIPWWQLFFPGFALFLYAISVNLLSDGLRDAFDPRLRR